MRSYIDVDLSTCSLQELDEKVCRAYHIKEVTMKKTAQWELVTKSVDKSVPDTEKQLFKVWKYEPTEEDMEAGRFVVQEPLALDVRMYDMDLPAGHYAAGVARANVRGEQLDDTLYAADFEIPEEPEPNPNEKVILVPANVTVIDAVPEPSPPQATRGG